MVTNKKRSGVLIWLRQCFLWLHEYRQLNQTPCKSILSLCLSVFHFFVVPLSRYATDKYIGKNAEDSLLSVLDEQTPFYLEGKGIADYGYKVTSTVASKIAGLKQ